MFLWQKVIYVFCVIYRPLPLVEVTVQTVEFTATDTAAYFPKGIARHLDQRERPILAVYQKKRK